MDGGAIEGQKDVHRHPTSPLKPHKIGFLAQIFVRALTTAAAVAATWIAITSKQTVVVFGIVVDARYSYSSAFKFFAYANIIVAAYTAISAFLLSIVGHKSFGTKKYFLLFILDLIMSSLLMAGCAAATAFGMIGQKGNEHAGWMAICDHFQKYCGRVTISIALSYFALVLLLILTIMSANYSRV